MAMNKMVFFDKDQIWKKYIIHMSLIIVLFLMGIFVGFVLRTNHIVSGQHLNTARAHFKNIVLTRRWNANHGGVFVKKEKGVISNPYLENPDIQAVDGTIYTKKNPALMTREISEYAKKSGDFAYHITSLKPLNPGNRPDDFEEAALISFEKGAQEKFSLMEENDKFIYRYMAPLGVEKACMPCHAKQGYKIGDIRGGISVTFDVTKTERDMSVNQYVFIGLAVLGSSVLLGVILFLTLRAAGKLSEAYSTIEKMSITDELTDLYNRRYFHARLDEEIQRSERYGHQMSLFMMDIDHFKKVNDTHGHQVGDAVLESVASIIKTNTRKVDIVARYGGEEFVAILSETGEQGALLVVEKLRRLIETHEFETSTKKTFHVTASFGICSMGMLPAVTADKSSFIIKMADEALYSAKKNGRNQAVLFSGQKPENG